MTTTRPDRRRLGHVRRSAGAPRRPARRRELGYSMIMTALLLIPMMTVAGFGVDVGSWYTRAGELQRAADAAALAGVVWMPGDFDEATSVARAASGRNGAVHGSNGVTVDVVKVTGKPNELDVIVTDTKVPTYMAAVVMDEITIERTARGRYVLPVPLGSPTNTFGNQNTSTTDPTNPQFFAHIQAPYTGKVQGDPYATKCTTYSTQTSCGSANSEYRPEGYTYMINVPPAGVGRTLSVDVFDARFRAGAADVGDGDRWLDVSPGSQPALQWELFEENDTPLDPSDNPSMVGKCTGGGPGQLKLGNTDTSTENTWRTICSFSVAKAGLYPLVVKSSAIAGTTDQGAGSAGYSLRAVSSGAGAQPQLYAYGDMSIQTSLLNSVSSLYLAEVEPIHAGKTFRIELFDPGDGSSGDFFLSIVQPDGSTATCSYGELNGTMSAQTSCRIQTRDDAASPANVYNGKWLAVDVRLPATYTCDSTSLTGCWWKAKYELTGAPTDRTTWRAQVLGDPVQLIR